MSYQGVKNMRRVGRQRGVTLFIVIIFVMLSMLLALWAARTAFFGEMVVGNDADYQRAFEAAQALMQDAELDINGQRSDGKPCEFGGVSDPTGKVCRKGGSIAKLPVETADLPAFLSDLSSQATRCLNALCAKRMGRQDFWNTTATVPTTLAVGEVRLAQMAVSGIGARYGEYTGAQIGSSTAPANPILADRSAATAGGWYWIEVMPYVDSKSGLITNAAANQLELSGLAPHAVYRITAIAYGRKPSTMVVLQQGYARPTEKN